MPPNLCSTVLGQRPEGQATDRSQESAQHTAPGASGASLPGLLSCEGEVIGSVTLQGTAIIVEGVNNREMELGGAHGQGRRLRFWRFLSIPRHRLRGRSPRSKARTDWPQHTRRKSGSTGNRSSCRAGGISQMRACTPARVCPKTRRPPTHAKGVIGGALGRQPLTRPTGYCGCLWRGPAPRGDAAASPTASPSAASREACPVSPPTGSVWRRR